MRSSDQARLGGVVRRRLRVLLLAAAASLLGLGASVPVDAQEEAAAVTGEQLFGAYQLDARGVGIQARYELEGILPGGAPVLDMAIPETTARFSSGPSGYGLAGLAYPGPLLGDLGVLLAQTGAGDEDSVPPWPIKAEAFFPSGPTEADESMGPAIQKVRTGDLGVEVVATFPGSSAPGVVTIEDISAATRTAVEGKAAISRTRVTLGGVNILNGLITIDSVVTDLVAAHDGTTGSTAGGTTVGGVRFLGLAARLDENGLVLAAAPPTDGPTKPIEDLLGGLLDPLKGVTEPVQDLVEQILDQAVPEVGGLLEQLGLSLEVLDPTEEQVESGAATRQSAGLTLTFTYKGKDQTALADLIESIPADLRPGLGPIPNPISFLTENHIGQVSLGPASVSALATPPFPMPDIPPPVDALPGGGAGGDLGAGSGLGDPGFSTPPAPLPAPAPGASDSFGRGPSATAGDPIASTLSGAIPALLVALLLLATPLFGWGSLRLADNVLAPVSTSCPMGLDQPPEPPRRT